MESALQSPDRPRIPRDGVDPAPATKPALRIRAAALVSSSIAVLLGAAPHVLHHAGPIAGTALLAGSTGTLLFGVIGLVASVPFLLRVHRRSGGWVVPAGLLAMFAAGFALSAFLIGPAIAGDDSSSGARPESIKPGVHPAHHQ